MARLPAIAVPLKQTRWEVFEEAGAEYLEIDWEGVIPPIPAAAAFIVVFASIWIHSQYRATGVEVFGSKIDDPSPFLDRPLPGFIGYPDGNSYYTDTSGGNLAGAPRAALGLPQWAQRPYVVYDHVWDTLYFPENPLWVGSEEGRMVREGIYQYVMKIPMPWPRFADNFFRVPVGPGNMVLPKFSFRDPQWRASYQPPEFPVPPFSTPREELAFTRPFPKIIGCNIRAPIFTGLARLARAAYGEEDLTDRRPTQYLVRDQRLIILPFLPDGSIKIGPGHRGMVPNWTRGLRGVR